MNPELPQCNPATLSSGFEAIITSGKVTGIRHANSNLTLLTIHGPILTSASSSLLTSTVQNLSQIPHATIPEALFTSSLSLKIGNFEITIKGDEAVKQWAEQVCNLKSTDIKPLKSAVGLKWSAPSSSSDPRTDTDSCLFTPSQISQTLPPYDWTFTSPYTSTSPPFLSSETSGIPIELLKNQNIPVIYYDTFKLYEDDLHDAGDTSLTVSIRVTSVYLFIRLRLFVRVDGVVIRNRDTRIFWGLEGDKVFKDVTWKEENWENLKVKEVKKWCGGEEEVSF
ncbi:hypothetical protein TrLO_g10988 [Triparma laevis f. longispina]|uniref:TIP41-like protein n=1 Tax=Triparma laevis f. longispina TaxID=1714387 RepID=A0A9W7DTR8_9STRA|nr:hypothetical protein TrLO_g10988 [Triparma laevis f. longispina]